MTIEYLGLADYVAIAAEVTGLDVDTVIKATNLDPGRLGAACPVGGLRRH